MEVAGLELYLDSADTREVLEAVKLNIRRVTTNPFLYAALNKDHLAVARDLYDVPGVKEVHIQVPGAKAEDFLKEAEKLSSLADKVLVKIPASIEGLKAIAKVKEMGIIRVTATAVITPSQAVMAAEAGADYVAILVGRAHRLGLRGFDVIKTAAEVFKNMRGGPRIIAASIHSEEQLVNSLIAGAQCVTVRYPLLIEVLSRKQISKLLSEIEGAWARLATKSGEKL